ncbi:MAG: hypothetical protein R3Y12_02445 [Clostridia bacterium]
MDNVVDKILEIYIKRGVNLDIAIKIFQNENKIYIEDEIYDFLLQTVGNT